MWLFAAMAVVGLIWDSACCGSAMPMAMGIAGLAVIIETLYVFYNAVILMMGYVIFVIAALLKRKALMGRSLGWLPEVP